MKFAEEAHVDFYSAPQVNTQRRKQIFFSGFRICSLCDCGFKAGANQDRRGPHPFRFFVFDNKQRNDIFDCVSRCFATSFHKTAALKDDKECHRFTVFEIGEAKVQFLHENMFWRENCYC